VFLHCKSSYIVGYSGLLLYPRNAMFHSASGLVEHCIPWVVVNLDIQHSSVQYLLIISNCKEPVSQIKWAGLLQN